MADDPPRALARGHVAAGLGHERAEPERLERDGLAAGVRTGDDERRCVRVEIDGERDDPAITWLFSERFLSRGRESLVEQRMASVEDVQLAVGRERRARSADHVVEDAARLQRGRFAGPRIQQAALHTNALLRRSTHEVLHQVMVENRKPVAHAHADDLVSRAADVVLKERRRLVLVPRETPLNLAHLRNMVAASEMGAVVFPPVPAFYHEPRSLDDEIGAGDRRR